MTISHPCWRIRVVLCLASVAFSPVAVGSALAEDLSFKVESNLRAAVAKVDITPPPGTPVVGHVRATEGVRNRLHVVVLLLHDGQTRAALVTTDLISASPALV